MEISCASTSLPVDQMRALNTWCTDPVFIAFTGAPVAANLLLDALIVEAVVRADGTPLHTEDMDHVRCPGELVIHDPFRTTGGSS